MLAHEMGLGKAQPLSSKILTSYCWKKMGEVKINDEIINSNGKISKVIDIFPQGIKDVYEITFSDKTKTKCTLDHLWNVQTTNWKFRGTGFKTLSLKTLMDLGIHNKYGTPKYYIPITKPINFKKNYFNQIHPYLLGALLGDGCFHKGMTTISNQDQDLLNCIKKIISPTLQLVQYSKNDYGLSGKSKKPNFITQTLKNLNLNNKKSYEKFIPKQYLFDSIENRIELLRGLLDTDGYISKKGTIQFYSTSERLINDVQFLVESFGGIAFLSTKIPFYYYKNKEKKIGRKCYILTIRLPGFFNPFFIKRKADRYKPNVKYKPLRAIKNIEYIGKEKTQCILTDSKDHLYLTDHCIITHNTKILIDILNHLWDKEKIDKVLILSPIEGIYNWRRELLRFSKFWKLEDISIASVTNRKPFKITAKIIICTYRTFLMLSDDYYKLNNPKKKGVKKYRNSTIPFDEWGVNRCIILDESHKFKNPKARITHVLNLHKKFFKFRYLATGTPAPNEIKDYYAQLKFMDEGIIQEDYFDWIRKMANIGNRFSKVAINYYYPEKVEEFINSIQSWIIRRKSNDCLELPDLIINKVYTELNKKQTAIYQDLTVYTLKKMGMNTKYNLKHIINKFPYFSLAIDNPELIKNDELIMDINLKKKLTSWNFLDHSKLSVCDSLVYKYMDENKKIIIWTGHPMTAESLAEHYSKHLPVIIHGQIEIPSKFTQSDYRDKLIEKFKQDKSKKLMIASYLVMGLAINLTEITRNIYFDRNYSLTDWLQSIKRSHRYGQKEKVIVDILICENTLDEHLDRLLTKKENVNKFLLGRVHLSIQDIRSLLMGKEIE
ncbi:hypothetical protein LCGC14_0825250 [marine sediment metagenome]|uniref:DOD-type homing endonuclease domain-containing protein n=1 Tax=marine sediment metagenome TaxID=412755 RepID=A0A0F9PHM4_9ZZZZ